MNVVGQVLAAVFVAVLLYVEIVRTPRLMARLRAAEAVGRADVRTRLYRVIVWTGWPTAVAALVVLLVGGLSPAEIGLGGADFSDPYAVEFALALGGGILLAAVLSLVRGAPRPVGDTALVMPRSALERRWYAGLAVTAGVTEEVYNRALPIQLFLALLPWHNRLPAVLLAAVVFGLSHRYQGIAGMLGTGWLAVVLGWIYVSTGSLWPGMLLHVALDLRFLIVRSGKRPTDEIAPDGLPVLRSRVDGRPLELRPRDESH